jgi:hypothetical protein
MCPPPPPLPAPPHPLRSRIVELNGDNFDENVQDGDAWLVTFKIDGCGACKAWAPLMNEVAEKGKGESARVHMP